MQVEEKKKKGTKEQEPKVPQEEYLDSRISSLTPTVLPAPGLGK